MKLTKKLESRGHKLLFFLPTFIIELKTKFQLEFNENEVANFFLSKFMDNPQIDPRTPV